MWMDAKLNNPFNVIFKVKNVKFKKRHAIFVKTVHCLLSVSYCLGITCIANRMNVTFKCDVVSMKIYLD